jgi:ketosteroid isomerase-like protein
MTESAILETIDAFWAARLKGDAAAMLSLASSDAQYEMVGASGFGDPKTYGPAAVAPAAARLIDEFKFHSLERLTAIVSGKQAAVVSRVQVSFRGGPPVISDVCDIWEFDDAGKMKALRQFVDTALVRRMIDGKV